MKMIPSCFPLRAGSKHVFLTWKVSFKVWPQVRSGQSPVMTQISQYTNLPKLIDESSRLAPFARLYLHPVATYWRKTDCDLIWANLTSGDLPWPRSSVAPGSSQMEWVAMILKELGGFGWFMWNEKHFHISPQAYNGEVTKLTWP